MGKGSGRHSGKGGGSDRGDVMGHEDFLLWKEFTRDIDPLEEPDWDALEQMLLPEKSPKRRGAEVAPATLPVLPVGLSGVTQSAAPVFPPQLDGRTDTRLRRGQMPIEARLDLHGCTQDEAHHRLNDFVVRAQTQGKRCVLVITGKGLSRGGAAEDGRTGGVLRQKLPMWLSMPPLRGLVLKCYPAVQRDGGTGAWYLYLRRDRGG